METDANVARHFSKSAEFLGRQSGTGLCDAGSAKGGDKFERVVRTHGSVVYRLALAQTRNRADAEDVFQEVFVALVRRTVDVGRGFESEEHLRAWLLRTTVHRCRDLARVLRRRRIQSLDEFSPDAAEGLFPCAAEQGRRLLEDEGARELWHAVGELPPKLRAAVHLFYVEEMSCEQIAQVLGVSTSVVTSRLNRARKQLKRSLKGRLS